ncbi:hypothetical protein IWQ57_006312, partial [Coemansia nantahalensis]
MSSSSSSSSNRPVAGQHALQFAPHPAGRYPQIVIKEPSTSEPKKARRKRITPEQLKELTAVFETADTPTHDVREELSQKLGMTNREVQVWFQNRRAKYNRMRVEQQRQMRTNQAIIYQSGLLGRMPPPPPPALPPASPLAPHHPHAAAYIYPRGPPAAPAAQPPPAAGPVFRGPSLAVPPSTAPQLHLHHAPCLAARDPFCGQDCRPASPGPGPAARRSTISSFSASDGVYGGSAAAVLPARSPPAQSSAYTMADGASPVASARSRYTPAVPGGGGGTTATNAWPAARTASPPDTRGRHPATAALPRVAVRLPSIQAMLAGARGEEGACGAGLGAGTAHASHRVRAYTSPPPPPDGPAPSESAAY